MYNSNLDLSPEKIEFARKLFSHADSKKIYLKHYNQLLNLNKVTLQTNRQPERRTCIVTFSIHGMNEADRVVKSLSENDITLSAEKDTSELHLIITTPNRKLTLC